MKRVVSILLVIVVLLNSVLFGIFYFIAKSELKKEFLAQFSISENKLPVTVITSDDINKNRKITALENDEIVIEGQYYDIFKTDFENGKKVYYCINDKNEEQLEKAFIGFLNSHAKNSSSKTNLNLLKLISMSGFPASFNNNSIYHGYMKYAVKDNFSLRDALIKIPTPPPESSYS